MSLVLDKIKLNPVLVASVLAAIGLAVQEGDVATWESLVAIVVGVVVRSFVTPNATAKDGAQEAFFEGLEAERLNGPV